MSVDEIKHGIVFLSPNERNEVFAFLFHLRHASDLEYQELVTSRLSDADRAHWLTPEEFERRLDQK